MYWLNQRVSSDLGVERVYHEVIELFCGFEEIWRTDEENQLFSDGNIHNSVLLCHFFMVKTKSLYNSNERKSCTSCKLH